jgi:predicted metal-dependent hydrolase
MPTHKSPKIDALLGRFPDLPDFNRHYVGFFRCFNEQLYYEAHDVLEEVWLPIRGTEQAKFYQGLIQVAGGFVHLQKGRLGPAARLLALALKNFEDYPTRHAGIDLDAIRKLCRDTRTAILDSSESVNPWSAEKPPQLALPTMGLTTRTARLSAPKAKWETVPPPKSSSGKKPRAL